MSINIDVTTVTTCSKCQLTFESQHGVKWCRSCLNSVSVMIAIPYSTDMVHWDFIKSLNNLDKPVNTVIEYQGFTITSAARNILAARAIDQDVDYLFFMDSDQTFHEATLMRLISQDQDVITGLYRNRKADPFYQIFRVNDKGHTKFVDQLEIVDNMRTDTIIPIDAAPTGCLLIKTTVLKGMPQPYFYYNDKTQYDAQIIEDLIADGISHEDLTKMQCFGYGKGEDINFCLDAKKCNFGVFADPAIICGHLTMVSVGSAQIIQPKRGDLSYE